MKYFFYFVTLAVFAVGCTALNNLAINVDAHAAIDTLQDRYNTCWECPLPSMLVGGNEIQALTRAGVYDIADVSPMELHRIVDRNTK